MPPAALRLCSLLMLLTFSTAAAGCLAVAAAAGAGAGVAYVQDELRATVDATPPQVVQAALAAFDDMNIAVIAHEHTDVDGVVNGRSAQNHRVIVTVNRETDTTSRIAIRVGIYGHRETSQHIYDRIRDFL